MTKVSGNQQIMEIGGYQNLSLKKLMEHTNIIGKAS
jgi:hypothetical protein